MFKLRKYLIPWLFFPISEIAVVLGNCSPDCTSCINDTCVTCELGTYLESGSCHTCPEHCSSCYNSEACNKCIDGYFGLSCLYECSSFCANSTCNKDSGICTSGCIDGYFLSGSSCSQCSSNCKTCGISSFNCVQCREGNYGASCDNPCSRCKDAICSKENCTYGCGDGFFQSNGACNLCTIHCRSCSDTFDNCHTCEDGYFGKDCQFPCNGCILCNQDDGSCSGTMNPPTTSTDLTTRLIASLTSVHKATTQPSTSVSPQTNTSPEQSQILTSTEYNNYQDNQSVDNIIIYAAVGGGGGLAFVVLVVVVLCKRRLKIKQTNGHNKSQIRETDGASSDYSTLTTGPREQDGHLYSSLDNTNSMVTMEPKSASRDRETHHAMHQVHEGGTGHGTYVNVN